MGYAGKRRGLSFRGGSGVFTHRGMSLCVNSRSGGGFPLTKKNRIRDVLNPARGWNFLKNYMENSTFAPFLSPLGLASAGMMARQEVG